jgi:aconitate hydratase
MRVNVRARRDGDEDITFETIARLDTPVEVEYYRHGGVLHKILRQMIAADGG